MNKSQINYSKLFGGSGFTAQGMALATRLGPQLLPIVEALEAEYMPTDTSEAAALVTS